MGYFDNFQDGEAMPRTNALASLTFPAPMMGGRRQAFYDYLKGTGYTGPMGGPEMHAYVASLRDQGMTPRKDFRAQYTPANAGGAPALNWQQGVPSGGWPGRPGGVVAPTPRPMYPPQTMPAQGIAVGEPYGAQPNALAMLGGARRFNPITRR